MERRVQRSSARGQNQSWPPITPGQQLLIAPLRKKSLSASSDVGSIGVFAVHEDVSLRSISRHKGFAHRRKYKVEGLMISD
jgi:hypothetical protein